MYIATTIVTSDRQSVVCTPLFFGKVRGASKLKVSILDVEAKAGENRLVFDGCAGKKRTDGQTGEGRGPRSRRAADGRRHVSANRQTNKQTLGHEGK